jgi:hypothetical protein
MSAALLTSVELESLECQVLVSKPELLTPPVGCESELDPCHYVVGKLFTCQSFTLLVSGLRQGLNTLTLVRALAQSLAQSFPGLFLQGEG